MVTTTESVQHSSWGARSRGGYYCPPRLGHRRNHQPYQMSIDSEVSVIILAQFPSMIHCIILRYSCWLSKLSPSERLPSQNSVCLFRFLNWITCAVHRTFPWCNHSCETGQVRVYECTSAFRSAIQYIHDSVLPSPRNVCVCVWCVCVCVCVCVKISITKQDGDNLLNSGKPTSYRCSWLPTRIPLKYNLQQKMLNYRLCASLSNIF